MYLGKIVEIGTEDEIYERPTHPYTQALLSAVPVPDPDARGHRDIIRLDGDVPSPGQPAVGLPVPHPLLEGPGASAPTEEPLLDPPRGRPAPVAPATSPRSAPPRPDARPRLPRSR